MTLMVLDPNVEQRLLAERKAIGIDLYDEVWEGVYMIVPPPDNRHREIVGRLTAILHGILGRPELGNVYPGINLSDRQDDWEYDFRIPDVAVFLRDGPAEDCHTHWRGAADFLVHVTSPGHRIREKIPFYGRLGVAELLLVERDPWRLELYRHRDGRLEQVAQSTLDTGEILASSVVGLTFRILPGPPRPQVEVSHADSGRCWSV